MCFCFDGESAVVAFRPENCRERLPGAGIRAERPTASQWEPSQFGAAGSFESTDAAYLHHIAVGMVSQYQPRPACGFYSPHPYRPPLLKEA